MKNSISDSCSLNNSIYCKRNVIIHLISKIGPERGQKKPWWAIFLSLREFDRTPKPRLSLQLNLKFQIPLDTQSNRQIETNSHRPSK